MKKIEIFERRVESAEMHFAVFHDRIGGGGRHTRRTDVVG